MRVLLIEDDNAIAQSIELMLKSKSIDVCSTGLGVDGIGLGKLHGYDVILLDLDLPDISGFEVLQALRGSNVTTPVLVLSAHADTESKIRGLGCGADDYMTKPFHSDELLARIHAIARRSREQKPVLIHTGDLCLNVNSKTAAVGGALLHLTRKQYQILELLSLRKGITCSKNLLLTNLYGGMDEPENKIIDVFICALRKKLAKASEGKNYIETVRGQGYVLRDPSKDGLRIALPSDETANTFYGDAEWEQAVQMPAAARGNGYLPAQS